MNRFLIVERDCNFCRHYFDIVNRINAALPIERRIRIIDTSMEEFGIQLNPILNRIKFEGTPHLYIDGVVLEGMSSPDFVEGFLKAYLGSELQ